MLSDAESRAGADEDAGWAEDWWDPNGTYATLHHINPLRLRFIERRIPLSGLRVADVGCGGGLLTERLARAGARVVGIDTSPAAIETARAHAHSSGLTIDYRLTDSHALRESDPQGFDLVTCMEMLEHVGDPQAIVKDCASLVRPGGVLVCSTINRTLASWILAIGVAEHLLGLTPKGLHRYERFVRPEEIIGWMQEAGFHLSDQRGLWYLPGLRTAILSGNLSVNYLLVFRQT
jgi:2-polyprenyl-6-hydroxyphenyl methylase/3-demethylubiquinone-9 3-methyltransferase